MSQKSYRIKMTSTIQREILQNKIWKIANEVRGSVVSVLWSTSINNPMSWVALLYEQRGKKSTDVCNDSRLAAERYEQETIL